MLDDVTVAAIFVFRGLAGFVLCRIQSGWFRGRFGSRLLFRSFRTKACGPPACAKRLGILAFLLTFAEFSQGTLLRFDDPVNSLRRSDENDNVVHDRGIARQALGRTDPFILFEAGVGDVIPVRIDAFRLDVDRFVVHVNDFVGSPIEQPAFGKLRGRRQLGRIAFGTTGVDPRVDQIFFAIGEDVLIGELAVSGIGVPRRHPLVTDDFRDHLAPAGHFIVLRHGEGTDFTRPMAGHAAFIEEPRNLVRIGHRRVLLRFPHAADNAAFCLGRGHAHRFACQDFVDGDCQVAPRQLRLCEAHAGAERVLVVNPPLVANDALSVDKKGLGRARLRRSRRPPGCSNP